MVFIDAHCHLEHKDFAKDFELVVGRMKQADVIALNTSGAPGENQRVLEHAKQHPGSLLCAIGLSPHDAPKADLQQELEFIEQNASKAAAIGEIGLDFYYFKKLEERNAQRNAFAAQLELAEKLGKPEFIQSREAEE